MKLNGCYACGTGTPQLIIENHGYFFQCRKCKSKTKTKINVLDAQKDWNEGVVYPGEEFWKMVFAKDGADKEY
ncbi:MAG: hypothetical protein IJN27_01750 [Oscillospiraceae bacterium]|nr:hypothetical protein [Oscillospiraceae bacterium]